MTERKPGFDIRQAGRRLGLALGLLFTVNAALYLFVVRPVVAEYRKLDASSQPGFERLARRTRQVEEREAFLAAVRQAETDLATLRNEILATRRERMVDVQLELDRLTRQFGINLDSVTYKNELLVGEELDRFEMVVPLEGGYANLRRFLQAVESSDKFLVVERVGLARGKDGGQLLELNITLATYFNAPARRGGPDRRAERRG